MEIKLALMIMALALGATPTAGAQEATRPQKPQYIASSPLHVDERFEQCVKEGKCTMKEHLELLNDIAAQMHKTASRMAQPCALKSYQDCALSDNERGRWYELYARMGQVMQSLEAVEMNQQTPAAGENSKQKRRGLW